MAVSKRALGCGGEKLCDGRFKITNKSVKSPRLEGYAVLAQTVLDASTLLLIKREVGGIICHGRQYGVALTFRTRIRTHKSFRARTQAGDKRGERARFHVEIYSPG
jgi:hypothetical protein